ncbi:MAG TPA: site-specific integrase [Candidatus Polarisedimenticolia bacterium]|jgi:integrase
MAKIFKRGKNYFMDYRNPPGRAGKRIREKIGPVTKDEATIVLSTRLKDIQEGKNPELRRIKLVLFADHAREVMAKHYANKRCHEWAEVEIESNLIPFFGETYLTAITPLTISGYMARREKDGLAATTINNERAVLSKVMALAVEWGRRHDNPVLHVPEREVLKGDPRFLTHKEADKLIEKAHRHLKPILITALETGGRRSEVLGLEWGHVKLDRGLLYFDQTNTKSGRRREIPLTPTLHAALSGLSKVRSISGRVFTWRGKRLVSVRTAFEKARTDAGLGAEVTFHTLRHTFASWYAMRGGDLFRLKELLGHGDIKTTMIYAHLSPEHMKAAVPLMGRQPEPPRAIGGHNVDTFQESPDRAASGSA